MGLSRLWLQGTSEDHSLEPSPRDGGPKPTRGLHIDRAAFLRGTCDTMKISEAPESKDLDTSLNSVTSCVTSGKELDLSEPIPHLLEGVFAGWLWGSNEITDVAVLYNPRGT